MNRLFNRIILICGFWVNYVASCFNFTTQMLNGMRAFKHPQMACFSSVGEL
jgi:hypothetical protein